MTLPHFTDPPRLAPIWQRPFVLWRQRKARAANDRAIRAAIDAMDALSGPDQFALCVARLQLLSDADAIPPHTLAWHADALGRAAHLAGRRART